METTNPIEISKLSTTLPDLVKNGVKLRQDQSKLIETLFYCYKLVGLNNFPTPGEEKILTDFIIGAYGGLVCEEIPIAFRLAVSGKFEGIEVNCFQNFSSEYFGRIMSAYWKYRQTELSKNQGTVYTPPPKPTQMEYYEACLFKPYDAFLKGGEYPFSTLDGWMLYDDLYKLGFTDVRLPEELREQFLDKARVLTPKKKRERLSDPEETKEEHEKRIIKKAKGLAFRRWIEIKQFEDADLRALITPLITK